MTNNLAIHLELDLFDEKRDQAAIRIAHCKDQAENYITGMSNPDGSALATWY